MEEKRKIRVLKERVDKLEALCRLSGIPELIVQMPELITIKHKKISKEDMEWVKEKIKEWEQRNK